MVASLTSAPLADASVDLIYCSHVLEHIPDDRAAIREIGRLLSPSGVALIQVPWRPDEATDEDPRASVEERIIRFGQSDHVRFYGSDFEERLAIDGMVVRRVVPTDFVPPVALRLFRLVGEEPLWFCSRSAQAEDDVREIGSVLISALSHELCRALSAIQISERGDCV